MVQESTHLPSSPTAWAYQTEDLPGIGGRIKQRPEDFCVEELPLYRPVGRGEHLYLYVEKQFLTTSDLARRLTRVLRLQREGVGYAGLKDKLAVTRQLFSVTLPDPSRDAEVLASLRQAGVKLWWAQRHTNKLKRGHLRGNRFVIRIREGQPPAVERVRQVLDHLAVTGVPNYIGEQRFGYRGNNHRVGQSLLLGRWRQTLDLMLGQPRESDFHTTRAGREAYERGDYAGALAVWPKYLRHERQALDALRQGRSDRQAVMAIDPRQREFLVSSFQSAIFNRVLDQRVREGLIGRLIEGDLAWKHDSRSVFRVDQTTAEAENTPDGRVAKLAVSPSGPMWGTHMAHAQGRVAEVERRALTDQGLEPDGLVGGPQARATGGRRPMRAVITNQDVRAGTDPHGPYIQVAFELPRGCFATVVLREIMKNQSPIAQEPQS